MKKVRIGNDIRNLEISVTRLSVPFTNWDELINLEIYAFIRCRRSYYITPSQILKEADKLRLYFDAKDLNIGEYDILIKFSIDDNNSPVVRQDKAIDIQSVFEIVEHTAQEYDSGNEFSVDLDYAHDGLSYYQIWSQYFEGTVEDMIAWHRQPAVDAANQVEQKLQEFSLTEQSWAEQEAIRQQNESIRTQSEILRNEAEDLRDSSESTREENEGLRQLAEISREEAEEARADAEILREQTKALMDELNTHPPILVQVDGRLIWHYWNTATDAYVSTGYIGSVTNKGAYNALTTYKPLDLVSYNDGTYMCITESIGNLPTTASFVVVAKGSYQYWLDAGNTGSLSDYLLWLNGKIDKTSVKQAYGTSETDILSQNLITLGTQNNEEVIAQSLVELRKEISALKARLNNILLDYAEVSLLDVITYRKEGAPLYIISTVVPAVVPDFAGQIYIKTTATIGVWIATGNSAVNNWKEV
jgi:hypothetical protein